MEVKQNMVRLKKHVLHRVEKRGVLVCDCRMGETLMFPKRYKQLLDKLKNGESKSVLNDRKYLNAIEDLFELNFLEPL